MNRRSSWPPGELPGKILAYLQRTPSIVRTEVALEDKTQSSLEKAIILLRVHTGHDFSLYKHNTLYRRIRSSRARQPGEREHPEASGCHWPDHQR